ncbi:hypothetical protein QQS21_012632 [Conoideocrella luteorostrata]|uniref:Uncharacterized protein n=1 Tax=Conoideocrella luteorostrata TaxID=1105319 RepID=A0AAJ0FSA6_9HYPO|nr:hypothetical protein QQS21_012632 [Conoideocrella luteorostrata]
MTTASDSAFSNTVIVFDALDECRPRDGAKLVDNLERFHTQSQSLDRQQWGWLKFLVTSRPYGELREGFHPVTQKFSHIHIRGEYENDQIHEEISLVVKLRVAELGESLNLSSEMRRRLEQQLIEMEHRTYLWLYLAMDDIRTTFRNSLQPEEESILLIPNSVGAAYEKILARVPAVSIPDVKLILKIIVAARRPLTIEEIAMALGMAKRPYSGTLDQARLNKQGLGGKIRQLCGLFVFINNSRLYLIHQTAREFLVCTESTEPHQSPRASLQWKKSIRPIEANRAIAETCVRVIDLLNHESLAISKEEPVEEWAKRFIRGRAFVEYAAKHWVLHLRLGNVVNEPELLPIISSICDPNTPAGKAWLRLYWNPLSYRQDSALSVTAYFGLTEVLQTHLGGVQSSNLNKKSRLDGRTALFWAAQNGHEDAVKLLLGSGIDVTSRDILGQTAVFYAVKSKHTNIVKLLLHKNLSSRSLGPLCNAALHLAVEMGNRSIVEALLKHGSDVNSRNELGRTSLIIAAGSDDADMVKVLLAWEANPRLRDMFGNSALHWALERRCYRVVKPLLDAGSELLDQKNFFGVELTSCTPEVAEIFYDAQQHIHGS